MAGVVPRQNYSSNTSERQKKRGLSWSESASWQLGWCFTNAAAPMNFSNASVVVWSMSDATASFKTVVTGSVESAAAGKILVNFLPVNLATNGVYDWDIRVSSAVDTLAYAYGEINLQKVVGGSTTPISLGTNMNYNLVTAYTGVAGAGPYRAGSNVTFSANADGSVDINGTLAAATNTTLAQAISAGAGNAGGLEITNAVDSTSQDGLITRQYVDTLASQLNQYAKLAGTAPFTEIQSFDKGFDFSGISTASGPSAEGMLRRHAQPGRTNLCYSPVTGDKRTIICTDLGLDNNNLTNVTVVGKAGLTEYLGSGSKLTGLVNTSVANSFTATQTFTNIGAVATFIPAGSWQRMGPIYVTVGTYLGSNAVFETVGPPPNAAVTNVRALAQ